jgi:hypothetical protein
VTFNEQVTSVLPVGRELVLKLTPSGEWHATVRSIEAGLSGGSCREYLGKAKTPDKAVDLVLGLVSRSGRKEGG